MAGWLVPLVMTAVSWGMQSYGSSKAAGETSDAIKNQTQLNSETISLQKQLMEEDIAMQYPYHKLLGYPAADRMGKTVMGMDVPMDEYGKATIANISSEMQRLGIDAQTQKDVMESVTASEPEYGWDRDTRRLKIGSGVGDTTARTVTGFGNLQSSTNLSNAIMQASGKADVAGYRQNIYNSALNSIGGLASYYEANKPSSTTSQRPFSLSSLYYDPISGWGR